jgi:hypothetical protein
MRQYTAQDAEAFTTAEEQLSKNGLDKWTQEGMQRNAELIDQFFQANPTLPVTLQNIYRAVETRKTEFVWLSQAQADWYQAAQQNRELANQLAAYLDTHGGKPGQLVNDGDQLFENLVALFNEIHSRHEQATSQTISAAQNRIENHRSMAHANGRGKQLRRVPIPRRTEPISPAAKAYEGVTSRNWLGEGMVKNSDGSYRSKTPQEQARDREAAEAAKSQAQTQAATLSASDQQWRSMAQEARNYGTHSDQAQIREVYAQQVASGASWREVYDRVNEVRSAIKRRREMLPA